ncbi:MAG: hypothetical protein M1424_01820 [Candidatus Thermoplasmatota archaeon]|jgi:hypothetical protein|nr:hypothetical protein [Candidatus Thermoplasmatota archaeon]
MGLGMAKALFNLEARVSSSNLQAVLDAVNDFIGKSGSAVVKGDVIEIKAEIEGESAKELNRKLLSDMRRVEKRTRLRAEWTSNGLTERFFDYVSKGTGKFAKE